MIFLKKPKTLITISLILFFSYLTISLINAETGTISLTIIKGFLTIKGSGSININPITSNPSIQEKTISGLNNLLQLQDKIGSCNGYYTTIQSDNLNYNGYSIPNENIKIKANNTINTIKGNINNAITIGNKILNSRGNIDKPVTYMQRANEQGCVIIGEYGNNPEMKISIPANQTGGDYKGKLYYLLIDNNQ